MVWCGVVWSDVVCGVVWYGVEWSGVVWQSFHPINVRLKVDIGTVERLILATIRL